MIGYHGDKTGSAKLSGRVWVALDREYAEGYATAATEGGWYFDGGEWREASGRVVEIDLSGYHILDLRGVGVEVDEDALAESLLAAGISTDQLGHGEMHQRVPVLAEAIRNAGYDAIAIREWTDGVGEAETVCILDYAN
ncbi:MAG: hypothetical protein K6T83_01065 [Alicyclobacillus sp.]|nr:hypothetical protein [Alicyclobacillus sp.]